MRDIRARTHAVYIQLCHGGNRNAREEFAMCNAASITYKNRGTNSVISSRGRAIMPPRRFARRKSTRDKNTQEIAFRHVMCARFAPSSALTASCPLLVAHAPHKVAGVQRAGIFLSSQGNDMAKCQRTNLDIARSLYSAFCSVGNVILRAMYDLSFVYRLAVNLR
jgi:hypothetical protein